MEHVAGLDWGGTSHAVCVIDRQSGAVVGHLEAAHDRNGIETMLRHLARIAPARDLPVAIERPSGLIVDARVAAGHPVVPIPCKAVRAWPDERVQWTRSSRARPGGPNVVKASRPRYRAAGGKERTIFRHWSEGNDDRGDACLLADLLRTDGHRFRALSPLSDEMRALRARSRGRDDLVVARVALANQLRCLLESFWPGAAAIFADIDSPIALAFPGKYPTPQGAARLGVKRMATFMAQHRYSGRRSPEDLLARLRAAPIGLAGEDESEAKGEVVRAIVATLTPLVARITDLSARIRHAMAEAPDGPIVMSFPRTGQICAALAIVLEPMADNGSLLAELGDDRTRYLTADQLAAEAGFAPVTRQSGKARGVTFRWACNHRLRAAIVQALIGTAKSNRIDPQAWLADVIARRPAATPG